MEIISRKEAKSLGLTRYYTGKKCKHGHVSERRTANGVCVDCGIVIDKKSRSNPAVKEKRKITRSAYTKENREKIREKQKENRLKNKESYSKTRKAYIQNNKDRILEKQREYHAKNKERIRNERRAYYRDYMRKRRNDPSFKAKSRMRDMLRRVLHKTGGKKTSGSEVMLGYTSQELRSHIESQFMPGMSWENLGEWHIDHIRSIKSFLDDGITDPKIINALSNLQPLFAIENLRKGA